MTGRKSAVFFFGLFFLAAAGLIVPHQASAVPAAPFSHSLSQPDGPSFQARQWGDENSNGWETEDGYSVVFDKSLGKWAYAQQSPDGRLVSSSRVVGRELPPYGLKKNLRPSEEALSTHPLKRHSREASGAAAPQGSSPLEVEGPQMAIPLSGTNNIPVILINFNNTSTTYNAANFNTLLFGTGTFSMKDYYSEVSYGIFTVSAGPGGVVGWYTASNTHDYFGTNDTNGNDMWPGDLVHDAVAAADAAGFNFAPYDQDGDCKVDVVNLVHQGTGAEASGITTDIWSHRWNLFSAQYFGNSHYGPYTTNDACPSGGFIRVDDYVIQPETLPVAFGGGQMTMGVFAHEYGHALGLPDLYDTDSSSEGIGNWSLMAGGSWNYAAKPGDRPSHLDAWSKFRLSWVTPKMVSGTITPSPIQQASAASDVYQLLSGTPLSGEYFLVENRQKTGFDVGLPGAGLLIWHIDGDKINANTNNTVNNYECYPGGPSCLTDHYGVKLVQSDNLWHLEHKYSPTPNRGDLGDPYPGSTNNTSFSPVSSPNSNLYSGALSNASVTNIGVSGGLMTATLSAPSTPSKIGIFDHGTWYLDSNQSWAWDGTPTDTLGVFGVGLTGAIPVVGDWNGNGTTKIGVYMDGIWYLDLNRNWQWDGEPTDKMGVFGVGLTGEVPVVGDWNGNGVTKIGVYMDGIWYLDLNNNWQWDGEPADKMGVFGIGLTGEVPVVGDWNGDGISEIGVYQDGIWYLDVNGSWAWDGSPSDTMGVFGIGLTNEVPVVGDWNADGTSEIGIYQEGLWYLDKNRSWQWDGEPTDQYGVFGVGLTDVVPVPGKW